MDKHFRPVLYIMVMMVFFVASYLFIDRGIYTKTKTLVKYQEKSSTNYKVYLLDNDRFKDEYLESGNSYIAKLVDYIDFTFRYSNIFNKNINGYYSYSVDTTIVGYKDSLENILWKKKNTLVDDTVVVLNTLNKKIDISENIKVDYKKYKKEFDLFNSDYNLSLSGYLLVEFKINMELDFNKVEETTNDEKVIKVIIPLDSDTFRIKTESPNNGVGSYDEFTDKLYVNYLLLIIGLFCLSVSISLLVVIIKLMIVISKKQSKYLKELKDIQSKYGDIIINIDKFYNKKKYNLIYVENFNELMDVYDKVKMPISFKEVKKNYEAIFLIIDDDNAWIYRMVADR